MINKENNKKIFTIKEVAERLDRSIDTVGRWQKEGAVSPAYRKNEGGNLTRYFSEEDIEILEGVKEQKLKNMLSGVGESDTHYVE